MRHTWPPLAGESSSPGSETRAMYMPPPAGGAPNSDACQLRKYFRSRERNPDGAILLKTFSYLPDGGLDCDTAKNIDSLLLTLDYQHQVAHRRLLRRALGVLHGRRPCQHCRGRRRVRAGLRRRLRAALLCGHRGRPESRQTKGSL